VLDALAKMFSKHERYKSIFYGDRLKLAAYCLVFCIVFLSRIEIFIGSPLLNYAVWVDLSKVALESSITFIAFDRVIGQIKRIQDKRKSV